DKVIHKCMKIIIKKYLVALKDFQKVEFADLMQIGRMNIYKSLRHFKSDKGANFFTFAYKAALQGFMAYRDKFERWVDFEKGMNSYHNDCGEDMTFEDVLNDRKQNVEKFVVAKVTIEQLLKRVNPYQKK